jgi:hypothetical protein
MKNKILKAISGVAAMVFITSGCALDSQSWLPYIVCGVSLAWLVLFFIANWEALHEC